MGKLFKRACRFGEELRDGTEIPIGVRYLHVPHIRRQSRQHRSEVGAFLLPCGETTRGKGVAKVVYPWATAPVLRFPAEMTHDSSEDMSDR